VKGGRIVILVETALLVLAAVCLYSLYERAKAEATEKDRRFAKLQQEHNELLLKYDDVGTAYAQLQKEMDAGGVQREAPFATVDEDMPTDVGELQRTLQYERQLYVELEEAFESMAERVDAYQQTDGAAENDEAGRNSFFGRGGPRRAPEMCQRMGQFADERIAELQRRIDSETDPRVQENLAAMGDSIQTLRELREQMQNAASDEERQQIRSQMREEGRQMGELARQGRRLEAESLAESFNIPKDKMDEFVRGVNQLGSSTGMFGGMMRGGRGGGRRGF